MAGSGGGYFTYTTIPEPATALAAAIGGFALLRRRTR